MISQGLNRFGALVTQGLNPGGADGLNGDSADGLETFLVIPTVTTEVLRTFTWTKLVDPILVTTTVDRTFAPVSFVATSAETEVELAAAAVTLADLAATTTTEQATAAASVIEPEATTEVQRTSAETSESSAKAKTTK